MFQFEREGRDCTAHWSATEPLTYDAIEAEALSLWKARAIARASCVYDYKADQMGTYIDVLAELALITEFDDDVDDDVGNLATCIADYLRYWGEQLACSAGGTWKIGLYGYNVFHFVHEDRTYIYRVRYRPHFIGGSNDHFEFRHIDEANKPAAFPNPVSDTGYRSEFVSCAHLDQCGDLSGWVTDYLRTCAANWQRPKYADQLSLFD